jgi:hypothetical protein
MDGLLDGALIGVMDRKDLAEIDRRYYTTARATVDGEQSKYTDEKHIRSGLADWEQAVITEAFPPGARVVVTAAGAGREILGLLEQGFDPVGYEPHEDLVKAGRAVLVADALPADRLRVSARDRFPDHTEHCDAVIIGWGSFSLVPGRHRRNELLRAARALLEPGAPMLVSFFPRGNNPYFPVAYRTATTLRRLRRAEPAEFGDALTPNFVHCFGPGEVEAELAAAGFSCERSAARPYPHALARAV